MKVAYISPGSNNECSSCQESLKGKSVIVVRIYKHFDFGLCLKCTKLLANQLNLFVKGGFCEEEVKDENRT